MNFTAPPIAGPDLDRLKTELQNLCERYSITRFEPDDILELLADGEAAAWIVNQLQQDNAELNVEKFTSVLSSIASIVAPPKEEIAAEEELAASAVEEKVELEPEAAPLLDLSQLDISRMGPELEALTGLRLPAGVDMNQIKKFMESPQGTFITDFGLYCQEQGIDMASLSDSNQLQTLNEQWMATPRIAFDGKTPAEIAQNDPSLFSLAKVETYRRSEPRIGRNDPCPCGSGKKYKKCCGKGK